MIPGPIWKFILLHKYAYNLDLDKLGISSSICMSTNNIPTKTPSPPHMGFLNTQRDLQHIDNSVRR